METDISEEIPECIFDNRKCEDCGFCKPSPLQIWLENNDVE